MKCEVITIGDEILIGQIINTNSVYIAEQLNLLGISIAQITSVGDRHEDIIIALRQAQGRADVIIVTGGLGPTKDDITKYTLCGFFKTDLVFNEEVYQHLKRMFSRKGKEVSELNKKQAEVPAGCSVLMNEIGTAPGMWFEKDNKIFVSLPGVPYEMKHLLNSRVIPKLQERFMIENVILHKNILTVGISESNLSELIADWEDALLPYLKLAYLPSPGVVKLRLTATGINRESLQKEMELQLAGLVQLISPYIFGYENDTLEAVVGKLLNENKFTVSTAESCTGGYLAHLITKVPGSSQYYQGSVVAYSYDLKMKELNVSEHLLNTKGAVSGEVVSEMAQNIREKYKTTFSLACSGIAGPGGGTADKPVGTVWIALGSPQGVMAKKFIFGEDRERNIHLTAIAALDMLRIMLLKLKLKSQNLI